MYISCHRYFFLVLLLNQRWSPPLRLQASHCSTFRIMCDVPSIAVFCSESIECFPGIVSKFFFKLLVTIRVAPIITGKIVHLRFHIRCISIHKRLFIIIIIIIINCIWVSPGGSGYFTYIQDMKLVTNKFKSGGLHEKHVVATWNLGNHLSICLNISAFSVVNIPCKTPNLKVEFSCWHLYVRRKTEAKIASYGRFCVRVKVK